MKCAAFGSAIALSCLTTAALGADRIDPGEIATVLNAIKAAPFIQEVLPINGRTVFTQNIVKYERIIFQDGGSIEFDVGDVPFVAIVTPVLQVRNSESGNYSAGYASSMANLIGTAGSQGANATVSFDPNSHGGGRAGGHGSDGGPAGPGRGINRAPIFIIVGEIRSPSGALSAEGIGRLRMGILGRGIDGGRGGTGGTAGSGGNGEGGAIGRFRPGRTICHKGECVDIDPVCLAEGGPPGPGGNPGRGGRGGRGADGGQGANVYLLAPGGVSEAMTFWHIDTAGGAVGGAGQSGASGQVGLGGAGWAGEACRAFPNGPSGTVPVPPNLGTDGPGGRPGARGQVFFADFPFANLRSR